MDFNQLNCKEWKMKISFLLALTFLFIGILFAPIAKANSPWANTFYYLDSQGHVIGESLQTCTSKRYYGGSIVQNYVEISVPCQYDSTVMVNCSGPVGANSWQSCSVSYIQPPTVQGQSLVAAYALPSGITLAQECTIVICNAPISYAVGSWLQDGITATVSIPDPRWPYQCTGWGSCI